MLLQQLFDIKKQSKLFSCMEIVRLISRLGSFFSIKTNNQTQSQFWIDLSGHSLQESIDLVYFNFNFIDTRIFLDMLDFIKLKLKYFLNQ